MISKEDLSDWNSHPVTQAIFSQVKKQVNELNSESVLMDTVDKTAMRAAYNDGKVSGAEAMLEAYEELEDPEEVSK